MVTILGAGVSGLGVAYRLRQHNQEYIIYEKESHYGGLCQKMEIAGFLFDRFVHFSFTEDQEVKQLFLDSAKKYIGHEPKAFNYYQQKWIAHPAQNNLYPLGKEEQDIILDGFRSRQQNDIPKRDYQEWLNEAFGEAFAQRFPNAYTRKYWTVEPKYLETKWVGERVLQSNLQEVEEGCQRTEPSNKFYTKEMRYPLNGAYQGFIDTWAEKEHVVYNHELIKWDNLNKTLYFQNGFKHIYTDIVSTLPLPFIISIMTDVPKDVHKASQKLYATKGVTISIGLKGELKKPMLWFYIYDEDILFARVYSPSMKSPNNVPLGCSSLQAEIYYSDLKPLNFSLDELVVHTIEKMVAMNIIDTEQVLFAEPHQFEYANVIFTHNIYKSRDKVRQWLLSQGIYTAGRFGEWGYLWSDQSLRSGLDTATKIVEKNN
ncbi:MAG: protoporphyrinogen/coproporphyrinogen oxidase [Brevinema sp.]